MIDEELVDKVLSQAQSTARHSWEYSTIFEALLEYQNPSLSVYNNPFPDGQIPTLNENDPALGYVKPFILTDGDKLCEGNGSSSDPSSLIIPALLLSKHDPIYLHAATRQLHSLLTLTPRYPNGAISHRDAYPSLWADFIYMVPPVLAYYAVFTNDLAMAREAVRQCQLYHDVLVTESGCWKHISNAPAVDESRHDAKTDPGLWSTSNAWAAAGMSRVLSTLRKGIFDKHTTSEQETLVEMIENILTGAILLDTHPSGLLRNRLDDATWFGDAAGTSLLAATVFRMAVLEPGVFDSKGRYVAWAVEKMDVVTRECVDEAGVVAPVVNPTSDDERRPLEGVSPEAQAFVVLMVAAWRDWRRMS